MAQIYNIPNTKRNIRYLETNKGCRKVLRKAETGNKIKMNFKSLSGSNWLNRILYEAYNNIQLTPSQCVVRSCNNSWCYNPKHLIAVQKGSVLNGYANAGKLVQTPLTYDQIVDIFTSPLSVIAYNKEYHIAGELIRRIRKSNLYADITKHLTQPCRAQKKKTEEEKRKYRREYWRNRYKDPKAKESLKIRRKKYEKKIKVFKRYIDMINATPYFYRDYLLTFPSKSL